MVREENFFGYGSYTIDNGALSLRVTEYGASILSLRLGGEEQVLGFSTLEDYEKSTAFIGATVGRWANRIGGAAFSLNGERYELCANEKGNTLHGGDAGKPWNKRRWTGKIESENAVSFTLVSPNGDNGFPGEMTVRVLYTVLPDRVRMDFAGVSDRDTFFCPTSHVYFSLGEDTILGASIRINAFGHLDVDDALIPTGKILPTEGDFVLPRQGGLQRYVWPGDADCFLEALDELAQSRADTPNKPDFPDALLRAGEKFSKYLEFVIE